MTSEDLKPSPMANARSISPRLRFSVLQRCGFRCVYCGAYAGVDAVLVIDHVVPVAKGGGRDPTNLVAACVDCNAGKSDRLLDVLPSHGPSHSTTALLCVHDEEALIRAGETNERLELAARRREVDRVFLPEFHDLPDVDADEAALFGAHWGDGCHCFECGPIVEARYFAAEMAR